MSKIIHKSTAKAKSVNGRSSRKLKRSLWSNVKRTFGFRRALSAADKHHYLNRLRTIYDVIKKHKHHPNHVLTTSDFRHVSPDRLIKILADVRSCYDWALVYSVPSSENSFLKVVIRIAHRMLEVTSAVETARKWKTEDVIHKSSGGIKTITKQPSAKIFKELCEFSGFKFGTAYTFAPSDACLQSPFYKAYLKQARDDKAFLKNILAHHVIPIDKLLNKTQFQTKSSFGYPVTIKHLNGQITHVNTAKVLASVPHSNVYIIDDTLGIQRPFGLTVFQKDIIETHITSICMLFSKHACTDPCSMGALTCSYTKGNKSVHSDMSYLKAMLIQTVKEFLILTPTLCYGTFSLLPEIEKVLGTMSLPHMTKALHNFILLPVRIISIPRSFLRSMNPIVQKLSGLGMNFTLISPVILAPILEEIMFRGVIKESIDKLLNVFKYKKAQPVVKSHKHKQPYLKTTRRSSTFDDLMNDSEAKEVNRLSYWMSAVFVSLWFALGHIGDHYNENQTIFMNRGDTWLHIIICFVFGMTVHIMTMHRTITVAILRHAIDNFLVHILPSIHNAIQDIIKTPPIISLQLPSYEFTHWEGEGTVPCIFVNKRGIKLPPVKIRFPPNSQPHLPINNLHVEYTFFTYDSTESDQKFQLYTTQIDVPSQQAYSGSWIKFPCAPSLQQQRGY